MNYQETHLEVAVHDAQLVHNGDSLSLRGACIRERTLHLSALACRQPASIIASQPGANGSYFNFTIQTYLQHLLPVEPDEVLINAAIRVAAAAAAAAARRLPPRGLVLRQQARQVNLSEFLCWICVWCEFGVCLVFMNHCMFSDRRGALPFVECVV